MTAIITASGVEAERLYSEGAGIRSEDGTLIALAQDVWFETEDGAHVQISSDDHAAILAEAYNLWFKARSATRSQPTQRTCASA